MGGKWLFSIKSEEKRTANFDLQRYQDELRQFKATCESEGVGASSFEVDQVIWAKNEAQAKETNVLPRSSTIATGTPFTEANPTGNSTGTHQSQKRLSAPQK